jgi:gamma-glutamyltranspeptidase/glutathione hydrolase
MERFDVAVLGTRHPDAVHRFIEAVKLAVADRIPLVADSGVADTAVGDLGVAGAATARSALARLLSDDYATERARAIDMRTAAAVMGEHYSDQVPPGAISSGLSQEVEGGMTTHFAIADSDGNVVSITQTLGGAFGAAVTMDDTGIFPNNMAYWFDLEARSPNRIGPGKKVDFVLAPTQTFSGGRFFLSMGTPGSWGIMQTTPQMLVNVLDHGMTVQQAIDAPRFRVYEGKRVEMEDRFPSSLRTDLEQRGHDIDLVESWSMNVGGGQAIAYDHKTGVFHGGADPRRDGVAIGY